MNGTVMIYDDIPWHWALDPKTFTEQDCVLLQLADRLEMIWDYKYIKVQMDRLAAEQGVTGGYTTGEGLVEVASVVVLVTDPNDASGRTGVVTYGKEFMRSDTGGWQIGEMEIWDSQAEADVSRATTTGLVDFRWGKIERGSSSVRNTYRLNISAGGEADPALIEALRAAGYVE